MPLYSPMSSYITPSKGNEIRSVIHRNDPGMKIMRRAGYDCGRSPTHILLERLDRALKAKNRLFRSLESAVLASASHPIRPEKAKA